MKPRDAIDTCQATLADKQTKLKELQDYFTKNAPQFAAELNACANGNIEAVGQNIQKCQAQNKIFKANKVSVDGLRAELAPIFDFLSAKKNGAVKVAQEIKVSDEKSTANSVDQLIEGLEKFLKNSEDAATQELSALNKEHIEQLANLAQMLSANMQKLSAGYDTVIQTATTKIAVAVAKFKELLAIEQQKFAVLQKLEAEKQAAQKKADAAKPAATPANNTAATTTPTPDKPASSSGMKAGA